MAGVYWLTYKKHPRKGGVSTTEPHLPQVFCRASHVATLTEGERFMESVTNLIEGVTPAKDDDRIVRAFEAATHKSSGGISKWSVGIRNGTGAVYRGCVLYGLDAVTYFATKMEALGFQDQGARKEAKESGFDSIFSKF
jgi:hypothetical protein